MRNIKKENKTSEREREVVEMSGAAELKTWSGKEKAAALRERRQQKKEI
jgi:hypothetical protein